MIGTSLVHAADNRLSQSESDNVVVTIAATTWQTTNKPQQVKLREEHNTDCYIKRMVQHLPATLSCLLTTKLPNPRLITFTQ